MSLFSTFHRIAADLRARRARYVTERAIGRLPPELRKDIGWPDMQGEAFRLREHSRYGRWA
jgi:hypothetical protein